MLTYTTTIQYCLDMQRNSCGWVPDSFQSSLISRCLSLLSRKVSCLSFVSLSVVLWLWHVATVADCRLTHLSHNRLRLLIVYDPISWVRSWNSFVFWTDNGCQNGMIERSILLQSRNRKIEILRFLNLFLKNTWFCMDKKKAEKYVWKYVLFHRHTATTITTGKHI